MQSVYNVSGNIFHPLLAHSLPFDCLEEHRRFASSSRRHPGLEQLLCEFLGTEEVLILESFSAAANLVFSSFVHGRAVTVWGGANELFTFFTRLWGHLMTGGARAVTRASAAEPEWRHNLHAQARITLRRQRYTAPEEYCLALDDASVYTGEVKIVSLEWLEDASLVDLSAFGFSRGLWVQDLVRHSAADLVIFSGGGLIGGPPLGFIAGNSNFLSRLKSMQLFHQIAPDPFKVELFAQLLKLYMEGKAWDNVPVLTALAAKTEDINARASALAEALKQSLGDFFDFAVRPAKTRLSEGEGVHFPTYHLIMKPLHQTAGAIWERLLQEQPAIIPGITGDEALYIDLRTLPAERDEVLQEALCRALRDPAKPLALRYMDLVPQLLWITDRQDNLFYLNKPCASFFGLQSSSIPAGEPVQGFLPAELAAETKELKETTLTSGTQAQKEICITSLQAGPLWLDLSVFPVRNEAGFITQFMYVASDITKRKTTEEELKHLSLHDALTGLYNRNYFDEELKRLNTERHFPLSIVIADIDALKFANDTLGHQYGDQLLKSVAAILKKTFRASDVVARIGGDEFAVILPLTDAKTAQNVLERVEPAVTAFNQTNDGLPLILSLGVATGEDTAAGIMDVFKKADDAMYKQKINMRPQLTQQITDALLRLMSNKSYLAVNQAASLQQFAGSLGRYLGLSDGEISRVLLLSKVYNIGRITLDRSTLFKPGALSPEEWEAVRQSPEAGYRIACSLPGLAIIANYILQHRERWDGRGYPQGLKGEDIHLYARILAVVDAYHAMLSPRPYREALHHEEALWELQRNKGTQFDPRITDIFLSIMEQRLLKI